MGLTKQDLKAVEMMLRELPKPEYEDLCDFIGLDAPELRILDLKYRHYTERYTREYIAEELGMSVSTFDRRKKAILKKSYGCTPPSGKIASIIIDDLMISY